ncbi:hypothetical protein [Candidatus Magnetomonas plexicatena]|uniref:hypothetical protein n=1 Tax=Candidatus Magnetomonas plexicatena TaxID=2552947 RepID=UPI001C74DF49|nr:hypothetical protein E2O03_004095 [Nitrospirales bacterium LBB_01]
MSKNKPKRKEKPSGKKKPNSDPANSPASIKQKMPVWRIGMIDFEGNWGWGKLNSMYDIKTILCKLKDFETMTWGEIEKKITRKGTPANHLISVDKICREARDRLREIKLDDYDNIYTLRFSGKERLWGFREAEILHILWWDNDHSVYQIQN